MHSVYVQTALVCYDAVVAMETTQVAIKPYQAYQTQSIHSLMLMHSVKNHSWQAYFDEVMPTCFRGPVFCPTVYNVIYPHSVWQSYFIISVHSKNQWLGLIGFSETQLPQFKLGRSRINIQVWNADDKTNKQNVQIPHTLWIIPAIHKCANF